MQDPIRITRNQLKAIIGNDEDAVKQFEKIFEVVNSLIETGVEEGLVAVEAQTSRALKQIGLLEKRVKALEP